jgi:hypothetical protein
MAEDKKEVPKENVPAQSAEQKKQRLKDFYKGGIRLG